MKCPLCGFLNKYSFKAHTQERGNARRLVATNCKGCGLIFLNDFYKDRTTIYDENYGPWGKSSRKDGKMIGLAKRSAFRHQLHFLLDHIDPIGPANTKKKLLDVGTGVGYLLDVAKDIGFDCYGVEISTYAANEACKRFPGKIFNGSLDSAAYPDHFFDVVTMTDFLEHVKNPSEVMREVSRVLKPNGLIFIITPNTDSILRALMGSHWFQYKYEHVLYWNRRSLKYLLDRFNIKFVAVKNNRKKFNMTYYYFYFKQYSFFLISDIFLSVYKILPRCIRNKEFTNPITGEMLVIARKPGYRESKNIKP